MVTPHFPPDSSAASHRVRLLAPYCAAHGWQPTVLTLDPRDYDGSVEPGLTALVPASLPVVRARAWKRSWTRPLGFGDLGLRALVNLRRVAGRLMTTERFDVVFITVYPVYPALLGPALKRRFGVRFVLDYQDPWVGSWGLTVGGGTNGTPDLRSRLSRHAGEWLEPMAVRAADAITAVSRGTYEGIVSRLPEAGRLVLEELPLGWDQTDVARLPRARGAVPFHESDGFTNLVYVGTLLPNGIETLRALLQSVARVRAVDPDGFARLRLWFFGTSNQFDPHAAARVLPLARSYGVDACVTEQTPRIPYAAALAVLREAHGVLLLGSTEPHYTASKLYPALLADRPILALFHEASSVVDVLGRVGGSTAVRLVTYGAAGPAAGERIECVTRHLLAMLRQPPVAAGFDLSPVADVSAPALARRLCSVMDRVCA
jgi:hypothetical protein